MFVQSICIFKHFNNFDAHLWNQYNYINCLVCASGTSDNWVRTIWHCGMPHGSKAQTSLLGLNIYIFFSIRVFPFGFLPRQLFCVHWPPGIITLSPRHSHKIPENYSNWTNLGHTSIPVTVLAGLEGCNHDD